MRSTIGEINSHLPHPFNATPATQPGLTAMRRSNRALVARLLKYAAGLRYRQLFIITGLLFLADLLIPDTIPLIDELLLGLLTLILGLIRHRPGPGVEGPAS